MTQSFDDAWKENRHVWESTKNLAKVMYLAGAQSRQTEIDELRKRIDEIKKHIENEKWFDEYGDYHCSVIEIIEIIKGTTNEQ